MTELYEFRVRYETLRICVLFYLNRILSGINLYMKEKSRICAKINSVAKNSNYIITQSLVTICFDYLIR